MTWGFRKLYCDLMNNLLWKNTVSSLLLRDCWIWTLKTSTKTPLTGVYFSVYSNSSLEPKVIIPVSLTRCFWCFTCSWEAVLCCILAMSTLLGAGRKWNFAHSGIWQQTVPNVVCASESGASLPCTFSCLCPNVTLWFSLDCCRHWLCAMNLTRWVSNLK